MSPKSPLVSQKKKKKCTYPSINVCINMAKIAFKLIISTAGEMTKQCYFNSCPETCSEELHLKNELVFHMFAVLAAIHGSRPHPRPTLCNQFFP